VAFSPNGRTVAAGDSEGTVWVWDVTADPPLGRPLALTNDADALMYCDSEAEPCGGDAISSLSFGQDGATITAVNNWPSSSTWSAATGQQLGATTILDDSGEYGGIFAALSADGTVGAQVLTT